LSFRSENDKINFFENMLLKLNKCVVFHNLFIRAFIMTLNNKSNI